MTPIQYLSELGFLGPEVALGHCVFHAGHSWTHYPYADDLGILADSGASVAHAPYKYAKIGLAPGARADLIVVNLSEMHFGAVHDPIKSLVECASGRDVEMIVVDGQTLLDAGRPTRVEEAGLLAQLQESADIYWERVPEWRARGETVDDIAPMSYALRPKDSSGAEK